MITLHDKLKRRWLMQYMTGLDADSLTPADHWHMARCLSWRFHHVKRMTAAVTAGLCDRRAVRQMVDSMPVCRQIEDDLFDYQERLTELTEDAAAGDITPEEYESAVEELALVVLLLAFLLGRNPNPDEAPEAEQSLIVSLQAYLALGGSSSDAAILISEFDALDLPDSIRTQLDETIAITEESVAGLTEAAATKGVEEGAASLASRLGLWIFTAFGMYNLGKMAQTSDPRLVWNLGATERHCGDCSRLAGQVHTASEWAASSFRPQGGNLECRGFRCDCGLSETSDPVSGSF